MSETKEQHGCDVEQYESTIERLRAQLDEVEEERLRSLTIRDYAIGVEKQVGLLRYELAQRDLLIHNLRTEIIETHAHLAAAIADSQAAHARLGRITRNPIVRIPLRARSLVKRVLSQVKGNRAS